MAKIAIFNEFLHEKTDECVKKIYPNGIHAALKEFLEADGHEVTTTTLEDHEKILTPEFLKNIDVLLWWGHMGHDKVSDTAAQNVRDAVHTGMGFIPLHSAHHSKPFKLLMGTPCNLSWGDNVKERIWIVDHSHPITAGFGRYFELPEEEMYGEPFSIPEPEKLLFVGWYESGEVFRSGCCYQRGNGKIFYFQPGHETVPTFHNKDVQQVIKNAVKWAVPSYRNEIPCPHVERVQ